MIGRLGEASSDGIAAGRAGAWIAVRLPPALGDRAMRAAARPKAGQ
jgi:hypothetical protein